MRIINRFKHLMRNCWRALLHTFWFIPGIVSLCGPSLAFIFLTLDKSTKGTLQHPISLMAMLWPQAHCSRQSLVIDHRGWLGLFDYHCCTPIGLEPVHPACPAWVLADRTTQVVAGGFFAIFAYALIVLTTTREPSPADPGFIPQLSITVAIGLGFLGLVLLLRLHPSYRKHHPGPSHCSTYHGTNHSSHRPAGQQTRKMKCMLKASLLKSNLCLQIWSLLAFMPRALGMYTE